MPRRPLPEDAAEHHWRDGWYFRRLSDGSVRIRHTAKQTVTPEMPIPGLETLTINLTLETDIPADEWAAIVQHVAAPIDTDIHHPPPPPPTPEAPKKKRRAGHRSPTPPFARKRR